MSHTRRRRLRRRLASTALCVLGTIQATTSTSGRASLRGLHSADRGLQVDYSAWYTKGLDGRDSSHGSVLPPAYVKKPIGTPSGGENRIVNGQEVADPADTTFFTMIQRRVGADTKRDAGCGASLISNCHALTAAHCVEGNRFGISTDVMVGAYAPYNDTQVNGGYPHFGSEIRDIQWHPEYNDFTNRYDVAVLTFETCMTPEELALVPPVQIAGTDFSHRNGEDVTVYGFGKTFEDQSKLDVGYYTEFLRQVTIPFIPYDQCNIMMWTSNTVYDDMVCAGGSNKDACQADSGGPAVVMRDGSPVQIGVVSWGVGCASEGQPGVYSSVSVHSEWIKGIVCDDVRTNPELRICGGTGISSEQTEPDIFEDENCIAEYQPCDDNVGTGCCSRSCGFKGSPDGVTRVCQPGSSSVFDDRRSKGGGDGRGGGAGGGGRGGAGADRGGGPAR